MLLLEAREMLMGRFRPILKEFALTEQQGRIIRGLDGEPSHELEAGQIAKSCCILSTSITGVLERMERDGLIRRTRAQEDQRRLIVRLTPQSCQLVTQISPRIDEQYRPIEQRFRADVFGEVYAALDKPIYIVCS
ncbi:homoprotocatechuate degradation operon regulator HpaR [Burkholderia pseudomallei]|uniref:homoprotocatechuate degradation operon regulator HpaR n=1 Tax=Burkholderia pseudomallei TaxID=28450 RepID=UPI00406D3814